jgi:hypothetical protein
MVGHEHLSLLSEHRSTEQERADGGAASTSWCRRCGRKDTPQPKAQGYPPEVRRQALRMCVDGGNLRRIGCSRASDRGQLGHGRFQRPAGDPPVPDRVDTAELDELYTILATPRFPFIVMDEEGDVRRPTPHYATVASLRGAAGSLPYDAGISRGWPARRSCPTVSTPPTSSCP